MVTPDSNSPDSSMTRRESIPGTGSAESWVFLNGRRGAEVLSYNWEKYIP